MNARLVLFLFVVALPACGPATAPADSSRIERGTALPPPSLAPELRRGDN